MSELKLIIEVNINQQVLFILEERIFTSILKGYLTKLSDSNNMTQIPNIVSINKDILFGNIREIYQFHSKLFLYEMEPIQNIVSEISKLFIKFVSQII